MLSEPPVVGRPQNGVARQGHAGSLANGIGRRGTDAVHAIVSTIASLRSSQLVASDHAVRSKGFPRDLGAVAVRHRAAGIRNDYPSDA
jgi:hypothetical protein